MTDPRPTEPSPTERFRQSLLAPTESGRFQQRQTAARLQRTLAVVFAVALGLLLLSLRMSACGDAGAGDLREAHHRLCLAPQNPQELERARAAARRAARAKPGEPYRVFLYQVTSAPTSGAPSTHDATVLHHLHAGAWPEARAALGQPDVRDNIAEGRADLWIRLLAKLEWMHANGCAVPDGTSPPAPSP